MNAQQAQGIRTGDRVRLTTTTVPASSGAADDESARLWTSNVAPMPQASSEPTYTVEYGDETGPLTYNETGSETMNANHSPRHIGDSPRVTTDPRETNAVQAASLGYHLTPTGKHAAYRTFDPRAAVGVKAPGIVHRVLNAINGGSPSSHSEPDSWDLISR